MRVAETRKVTIGFQFVYPLAYASNEGLEPEEIKALDAFERDMVNDGFDPSSFEFEHDEEGNTVDPYFGFDDLTGIMGDVYDVTFYRFERD